MQNPLLYTSPLLPTVQAVKDAIQFRRGVATIHGRVRLLDQTLKPKELVNPPNKDDPSDISKYVVGCTIEHNADRDVPRSCKLTMRESVGIRQNINTLADRFRVSVVYRDSAFRELMDVPVGIFCFLIADKTIGASQVTWEVGGADLMFIVSKLLFLNTYIVPGTSVPIGGSGTPDWLSFIVGPQVFLDTIKAVLEADSRTPSEGGRSRSPGGIPGDIRYDAAGFLVTDPRSNCYLATGVGWLHPDTRDSSVTYNPGTGTLVNPDTGAPIDPTSSGADMTFQMLPDATGRLRPEYVTANGYIFDPATGDFYKSISNAQMDAAYSPRDGTVVPQGSAILLQYANGLDANAVGWPDANRPGLTPSGCDFYGADIPPERVHVEPYGGTGLGGLFPPPFNRDDQVLPALNGLAAAVNYESLWADERWVARCRPIPWAPQDSNGLAYIPTAADWTYSTHDDPDNPSIIDGSPTARIVDQGSIANVVQVVSEHDRQLPLARTLTNESPDSAISYPNLGYRVIKAVKDDKLITAEQVLLRAWVELNYAAIGAETVEFDTWVNPFHQNRDLLNLNIYSNRGEVLEVDSKSKFYPFQESSWTLDLITLKQHHAAGRLVAL